jgi:hypothetical protein
MRDRAGNEEDNEVCRMLIRKRAKLHIGRRDPFEDWATEFHCEGRLYFLNQRFTQYGLQYTLFTKYDTWSKDRTYFDVAPHLLDTLWDVIQELQHVQDAERKSQTRASILAA